jgi:hypothetical protein
MTEQTIGGFVNATTFDWLDLTDELWREYVFPGGHTIRIEAPAKVAIKAPSVGSVGGGSHRVIDANGGSHYISYGWLAIRWQVREGALPVAW